MKFPAENVLKNNLLIQEKYSVEINCLSFQRNHSLNTFLTNNESNILVFQEKHVIMVIHQEIKHTYGDLTWVFSYMQINRKC